MRIAVYLKCRLRIGRKGDKLGERANDEYGVSGGSVQSEKGEKGAGENIIPGDSSSLLPISESASQSLLNFSR